uniref:Uncharacterized protein n=1 Tax=Strombidium rassoulzadegani TaxID=1082188 RepID=A0A7S3CUC5_9SPIT|mmetsp:Transcript_9679/g.16280  ORF Transcript_9679/g.16280 Transcript_9679/m.16280 type:complete len:233 (+) Transcript_9679:56-754(+)
MTEYLYDRENPKSNFRQRLTGIEGFMYGNPNMNERADMIGRALAKETDGDFTKFVMKTAKPRDMAQKWRMFKNIARFVKNPFGYLFWKQMTITSQNRFRLTWFLLIWHLYQSFALYMLTKNKKEGMIHKWYWHIGMVNHYYGAPKSRYFFPADRKKNYVRYSNFHQMRQNKRTSMIHTNWWCRDQNFRKYFDMRKRNDIKPALSGFKDEPIYNEQMRQMQEWIDLRHSKQSK